MPVGLASWFAGRTGLDAVVPLEPPAGHPLGADQRYEVGLSNPAFSVLMGFSDGTGMTVSEQSATTLSAVFRAVSLIAGAVAQLPLRTLERDGETKRRVASPVLDNPGGDRYTQAEWVELVMAHLLLHGNAYLQHIYGGARQLVALYPVHPSQVVVEWDDSRPGGKVYKVTALHGDGTRTVKLDASTMTQVMGPSLDGLTGLSVVSQARLSLGTALAGDKSANRQFRNGAMISGMVTPADADDDLTEDEARAAKDTINRVMVGPENAGDIPVMSKRLQFTPWQMNAADAQFLQSRTFSVEEVARWFGVPPHLLALDGHTSNWGTGIQEQNRGLARYTLKPWTTRLEQRLTRLLYSPRRFAEFDYTAFLQPSPEDEITLLIAQVNAGLITPNEARAIRNMPPVQDGDVLRTPAGAAVPSAAPAGSSDEQGES